jgi:hypothetical protein
MAGDWWVSP